MTDDLPADARRLPRSFYLQDSRTVARELIGKVLARRVGNAVLAGRIVETEAYAGACDAASHAYRNRRTDRTDILFGAGGYAYVFLIYGLHACMNVVAGEENCGEGVLLRALEPLRGIEIMRRARGCADPCRLCAGPGNLTRAMGITTADYGLDLCGDTLYIEDDGFLAPPALVKTSPRIRVEYADEDGLLPWRFYLAGSDCISEKAFTKRYERSGGQR